MTWTETKFSAFNLAFLRRQVVESMESRKNAMISGLYGNSNLDDNKGTRQRIISDMENNFREAIAELYEPTAHLNLKDDPFFKAMHVPGEDIDWEKYAEDNPNPIKQQVNPLDDIEVDQN
jgi:hypothetical protein